MSSPELMDSETGRTTPEFLGGAKNQVGNNAEIDCCYSRWLRYRLFSTGTNTRASTAAGRNDYTSPLRLRPRQNPRRGCLRDQDHHSAHPQGSPEGLPQRRLLTRSGTERTGPQASPLAACYNYFETARFQTRQPPCLGRGEAPVGRSVLKRTCRSISAADISGSVDAWPLGSVGSGECSRAIATLVDRCGSRSRDGASAASTG